MATTHVTIRVKQLPEGVFLATSEEVPGLTVECDTRDEIIATAPEIALELLEIEAGHPLPQSPGGDVRLRLRQHGFDDE